MNNVSIAKLYQEIKRAHPALTGRLERGVNLANGGHVNQTADSVYAVKSLTTGASYMVSFEPMTAPNPGWSCGCADIRNGAPTLDYCGSARSRICKHIVAASLTWMLEDQSATEPAFIQQAPQWRIESAAGFTAEVSRDGKARYIDS
jgi:hypothetical protein